MTCFDGLLVGDPVFVVEDGANRRLHPVAFDAVVTKVGRKWATVTGRMRFLIDNGRLDGGQYASPGTVYASREAARSALQAQENFNAARYALAAHHRLPAALVNVILMELDVTVPAVRFADEDGE